ncbi:MAG TPA: metallophosphoesterase family protein [Aliidongia sp.]|uniref:metallophosphoesterase family protein n=1 Tax=Aliidongia sp. TaxID=1914230 RepID=UPI002DDCE3A9|nr:metallophosphoesterase family protein [Aliidongia sp.]HEV2678759.1 metallophosphoesterase family protein [Aliidongia sp.]
MFGWRRGHKQLTKPEVPEGLRLYVIGDIHGCVEPLDALHELIRHDLILTQAKEHLIVYLGDYIDRGPSSADVLDRLIDNPLDNVTAIHLKGNHEAMMMAFFEQPEEVGPKWFAIGGAATVASYGLPWRGGQELPRLAQDLSDRLPKSHHDFLDSLVTQHRLGDFFFVHAGVRPGVPLARQREMDLLWIRSPFLGSKISHGAVVVHGHTPVSQPEEFPNRIAIDTGAFFTGVLTCLVLEAGQRRYLATNS